MKLIRMTIPMARRQEVEINGEVVRITRRRAHLLLEVLLIRGHKWSSVNDLIEAIWPNPDFEPDYAKNAIQQHIMSLRDLGIEITNFPSVGYRLRQIGDPLDREPAPIKKRRRVSTRFALNPADWWREG